MNYTFAQKRVGAEAFGRQWVNYEAFVSSWRIIHAFLELLPLLPNPIGRTFACPQALTRSCSLFEPVSIVAMFSYACCRQIIQQIYSRRYYTLLWGNLVMVKMIFFVHDTIDLRDDIVRWLRRWNKPSSIVSSYHGSLANESKIDIHTKNVHRSCS
jgi:hypothetical protein